MASTCILVGLVLLMFITHFQLPCTSGPLGMESRAIPDKSITASSNEFRNSAKTARLNVDQPSDGWVPNYPLANEWIQVDFRNMVAITGITLQGQVSYHVKTFTVMYGNTGEDWQSLPDSEGQALQLQGNDDSGEQVTAVFPIPLIGRFLRIVPTTWTVSRYFLTFEVLGCREFDGVVRLADGDGITSGRVEIFHDDAWGVVCDRDWDFKDATTVCNQLGFIEALEATNESFFRGSADLPAVMDRVACTGTEDMLSDCPFVCPSTEQCIKGQTVGVICKPNTIRLVGGNNGSSGRVEIYRDGRWGTICDNDWDITDAAVICRQLGFSDAEEAKSGAFFGQGEGAIHMDRLMCDGSESVIIDCPSHCWEKPTCDHAQDAGVICQDDNA